MNNILERFKELQIDMDYTKSSLFNAADNHYSTFLRIRLIIRFASFILLLLLAVNDLKKSSDTKNPELINRRNREATLLDSTKAPLYSKPNEAPLPARYAFKRFKWVWHNSGSKNPNTYHRDVLNGNEYPLNSQQWELMTSHKLKGCNCTYEIVN